MQQCNGKQGHANAALRSGSPLKNCFWESTAHEKVHEYDAKCILFCEIPVKFETIDMVYLDEIICSFDNALRTLGVPRPSSTSYPPNDLPVTALPLSTEEKRTSGAFMRVNHVGEVCAQALYNGQALATRSPELKKMLNSASQEETDHLAWTAQRLTELGTHQSRLNVLWYAGSFCLGWTAGKFGDAISLGFTVETERQVEQHLSKHLSKLPQNDLASLSIVQQMKADEARHADAAEKAGAQPLPPWIKLGMKAAAKVMTTVSHYL